MIVTPGVVLAALRRQKHQRRNYRIVSLCPSTTVTLYDLGLEEHVLGRTRYCDRPPSSHHIPQKVGGTKDPDWAAIRALKPTHILFNMEENDYTQLPQARAICETINDTPINIKESRQVVLDLGRAFDAFEPAKRISDELDSALESLKMARTTTFTYLYFIWHTPEQRVVGRGTYIEDMLTAAGGTNLARSFSDERYPLFPSDFQEKADYCLLSTEPYPFKDKHVPKYQKFGNKVRIIDGQMLSWHGSRTVEGLRYLEHFFNDDRT